MKENNLYTRFEEPTAEYRGKPFWAWNGKMEEEKLIEQISVFKEMGFGGFFMHSRAGLETEYLGEEWFRLIEACTLEAKKQGMESWIYDEDRWPSGCAGGLATEKEEFRAHFLHMKKLNGQQWENFTGSAAAVFACVFYGDTLEGKRKIEIGDAVAEEEEVLVFSISQAPVGDVYNGNTYLDTMNPKAVECFLHITHEKYVEKVQDFSEIQGIFTDEPHRGPMFTAFSGGMEEQVPYTPGLFEEFSDKYGYDLLDMLPELFFLKKEEELSKVTYDYVELCQELFLESYAAQMSLWCQKHKLLLTGHVLHEDSLMAQTMMQGSLMRFYPYMDYPGVDVLLRDNHCFWIIKQVVSVARQTGKKKVLSELYGATGWQATLEDYKNMGDWQTLFGINLRCQHLALYTMQGEGKRDYPASIFSQLTDYKAYRPLEDYFSRLHVFMDVGEADCHVLVIHPVESIWARSHYGAYHYLEARDAWMNQVEKEFEALFWMLVQSQVDFDYGDEGLMAEYGSVKDSALYIDKCRYTKVIVSGMRTMRSSTFDLFQKFYDEGGEIIFVGDAPKYVDVIKNQAPEKMAEMCTKIPFSVEAVEKTFAGDCMIKVNGPGRRDILVQCRKEENESRYMVWNSDLASEKKKIELIFPERTVVEIWNPENGTVTLPENMYGQGKYICDFAPGEMKLYRAVHVGKNRQSFGETADFAGAKAAPVRKVRKVILEEALSYELSEPNVCVLDRVSVHIPEYVCKKEEVLRADTELREILGFPAKDGEMLQPWYQKKYRPEQSGKKQDVELVYEFEIQDMPKNIALALEQENSSLKILINGQCISSQAEGFWVDSCFHKIPIPNDVLKKGVNEIRIQDKIDIYHGIEAVFLLGKFAVEINKDHTPVLKKLPETIVFGNLCQQGFPFYSGKIRYLIPEMQGKICRVTLQKPKAWAMRLIGDTQVNVSWAPYQGIVKNLSSIELILTRKNIFGPLHQSKADPPLCGPESFRTTGADWSDSYVLQVQGLMERPEIVEVIYENEKRDA